MSRLARRLWRGLWSRQSLGSIVIKFYPQSAEASITVAPRLAGLSRRYWHWLYLQHLAESLAVIGETQERLRLLVATRAMAEDFVSRSSWPHVMGESISNAGAGAADIVPERAGGVGVTAHVVQRGGGIPAMRLAWSPPQARDRIASSNLVLLVHVMRNATHALEQYELFKKIALFAEYCEQAGCPRERAKLTAGPLYAVVHADVTEMLSPSGLWRHKVIGSGAGAGKDTHRGGEAPAVSAASDGLLPAQPPRRDRHTSRDPFWKRSGAAIGAAAFLWAGLLLGAFLLPRSGNPVFGPRPVASVPAAGHPQDAVSPPRQGEGRPEMQAPLPSAVALHPAPAAEAKPAAPPGAAAPRAAAALPRLKPSPQAEGTALPKFRVVSGTIALDVAEHRSRILAEQGVDSFVRERAGKVGRLQYGAYRSREVAEEDARHFRAQGYTAVVIPY